MACIKGHRTTSCGILACRHKIFWTVKRPGRPSSTCNCRFLGINGPCKCVTATGPCTHKPKKGQKRTEDCRCDEQGRFCCWLEEPHWDVLMKEGNPEVNLYATTEDLRANSTQSPASSSQGPSTPQRGSHSRSVSSSGSEMRVEAPRHPPQSFIAQPYPTRFGIMGIGAPMGNDGHQAPDVFTWQDAAPQMPAGLQPHFTFNQPQMAPQDVTPVSPGNWVPEQLHLIQGQVDAYEPLSNPGISPWAEPFNPTQMGAANAMYDFGGITAPSPPLQSAYAFPNGLDRFGLPGNEYGTAMPLQGFQPNMRDSGHGMPLQNRMVSTRSTDMPYTVDNYGNAIDPRQISQDPRASTSNLRGRTLSNGYTQRSAEVQFARSLGLEGGIGGMGRDELPHRAHYVGNGMAAQTNGYAFRHLRHGMEPRVFGTNIGQDILTNHESSNTTMPTEAQQLQDFATAMQSPVPSEYKTRHGLSELELVVTRSTQSRPDPAPQSQFSGETPSQVISSPIQSVPRASTFEFHDNVRPPEISHSVQSQHVQGPNGHSEMSRTMDELTGHSRSQALRHDSQSAEGFGPVEDEETPKPMILDFPDDLRSQHVHDQDAQSRTDEKDELQSQIKPVQNGQSQYDHNPDAQSDDEAEQDGYEFLLAEQFEEELTVCEQFVAYQAKKALLKSEWAQEEIAHDELQRESPHGLSTLAASSNQDVEMPDFDRQYYSLQRPAAMCQKCGSTTCTCKACPSLMQNTSNGSWAKGCSKRHDRPSFPFVGLPAMPTAAFPSSSCCQTTAPPDAASCFGPAADLGSVYDQVIADIPAAVSSCCGPGRVETSAPDNDLWRTQDQDLTDMLAADLDNSLDGDTNMMDGSTFDPEGAVDVFDWVEESSHSEVSSSHRRDTGQMPLRQRSQFAERNLK